jgi:hypothetical protein
MTPEEACNSFITSTTRKRELEQQLRACADELDEAGRIIREHFQETNRTQVKQDGHTIYMQRDLSIATLYGDSGQVVAAVKKAGLSELLGINHPKFKKWAKERMEDSTTGTWEINPKKLPPTIAAVVDMRERNSIRCSTSKGKR